MSARPSYVLVGLFVLFLGAALIAGILWLTTGGPPRDYEYYYVYMTESVSGLNIDAPVKYKGVSRGRVREIELDPDDPERIRLLLVVLKGTPINAETRATLEYSGITGIASINLKGGGKHSAPLKKRANEKYPVIQSEPSLLARFDQTVSELLATLIETSQRMSALLDEQNREMIGTTLANLAELTGTLNERLEEVETLMADANRLVEHLQSASAGFPELVAQFKASGASLERMADTLAEAGANLGASGSSLQRAVEASGQDLQRFAATTLPEAATLVTDLRYAAENLRRVSESLERDPRVLLFGPAEPPPGPGEQGGRR